MIIVAKIFAKDSIYRQGSDMNNRSNLLIEQEVRDAQQPPGIVMVKGAS
jgi:hypothetical protein